MAAGILSVDADTLQQPLVSDVLLMLAAVAFVVIAARNILGTMRAGVRPTWGTRDAGPAIVLFTWTAACGVLAQRLAGENLAAAVFSALSVAGFAAAVAVAVRAVRASGFEGLGREVRGSWLLAVVACQSVAILAAATSRAFAAAMWIGGLVLYGVLIALMIRRVVIRNFSRKHFTPDYWITMGALAISTVAATKVDPASDLVLWISAIAWPPLLVAMEIWRARANLGAVLTYDTMRWATVFPLGMRALATFDTAHSARIPGLSDWAWIFFAAAIAVAIINLGAWLFSLRSEAL